MQVTIKRHVYVNELQRRREAMLREVNSFFDACEGSDVEEVKYALPDIKDEFVKFVKAGLTLVEKSNNEPPTVSYR